MIIWPNQIENTLSMGTGKMKRVCLALLTPAVLSGCAVVNRAISSETFGGVQVAASQCPERVVFLLDVSGSMEGKEELVGGVVAGRAQQATNAVDQRVGRIVGDIVRNNVSVVTADKLTVAKFHLNRAIQGLYEQATFHVMAFGNQTGSYRGGFSSDKAGALLWISARSAEGGTPVHAALQSASRLQGVNTIFLFSDGQPTDAGADAILRDVARWNASGRVRIHTIGVGPDQDQGFLCQLAQQNGGTYTRDGQIQCGERPLVIFVGGANDAVHRNMLNTYCAFNEPGLDKEYYSHDEESTIARRIERRRAAFPRAPIAVVGHSWGGDTGYDAVDGATVPVDLLVTLDAVSLSSADQASKPSSVGRWINVWVEPGPNDCLPNLVMDLAGHWGRQGAAEDYKASAAEAPSHCHANGMLRTARVLGALRALRSARQ
jgi:pimeloyl-ACP methyl ester carboxylesterase